MRYFFHIRSSDRFVEDLDGLDLNGIEAVRREADEGARDMIAENLRSSRRIDLDTQFEVRDEGGDIVYRISFLEALGACGPPAPGEPLQPGPA